MQLEAVIILRESDLTKAGEKLFEETEEVFLSSFSKEIRYACLKSNLILFISNCGITYVLRNRYGNTGSID